MHYGFLLSTFINYINTLSYEKIVCIYRKAVYERYFLQLNKKIIKSICKENNYFHMSDIKIKKYEKGDEYGIIELLNKTFTNWHQKSNCSQIEYWRWKYLKNPFPENFVTLALDGQRTVGCFHSFPQRIKIGENVYNSSTGTDLAVDQDYRNLGIYGKMRKLQRNLEKEKIFFHYGVSNNPILIKKNIKENHGKLPYVPLTYVKIDDLNLHIEKTGKISLTQKYGFKAIKLFNKVIKTKSNNEEDNVDIIQVNQFNEEVDKFWNKICGNYNFIVERKMTYLNWRYCDTNCNNYIVFKAEKNNEFMGYMVLKILINEDNYQYGYIVDIIGIKKEIVNILLKMAINFFKENSVNIIQWQITQNHPYIILAVEHNFVNSRKIHPLDYPRETLQIGIDEKKLQQSLPDKIHFAFGDYDFA
jgi:hypothetical protein